MIKLKYSEVKKVLKTSYKKLLTCESADNLFTRLGKDVGWRTIKNSPGVYLFICEAPGEHTNISVVIIL